MEPYFRTWNFLDICNLDEKLLNLQFFRRRTPEPGCLDSEPSDLMKYFQSESQISEILYRKNFQSGKPHL